MSNIVELLERLQELVGERPLFSIDKFENWSGLQTIQDLLVVSPADLQELKEVICAARTLKLKVRCVGSGHSWSELFPDEKNVLIRIDKLRKIQLVWNSEMTEVESVRLLCGSTLQDLMDLEKQYDFNLHCNVIVPFPTFGGVVAPACHGVGWDYQSISDYIKAMTIVNANGQAKRYSKTDNPDMLKAVQCSLGLFGVIYEIELEVFQKQRATVVNDFETKVGDLFYDKAKLKMLVKSYDSMEIFWFPFQSLSYLNPGGWDAKKDKTWVRKINIADPVSTKLENNFKAPKTRKDAFAGPPILPKLSYTTCKLQYQNADPEVDLVDAIHYLSPLVAGVKVHDMEWAFDVKDDFSTITTACQKVICLVESYAKDDQYPMDMVMEMRWMGYSDAYLCPAMVGNPNDSVKGSGHTVYLEVLAQANAEHWEKFCNEVATLWTSIPGINPPRVHWAKEWGFINGIDDYIRQSYGNEISLFKDCLETSGADPDKMFMNKRLEGIFYPDEDGEEPTMKKRKSGKRK